MVCYHSTLDLYLFAAVIVVEPVKAQTPVVSGTAEVTDGSSTTLTCTSSSSLVEASYVWKVDGVTVSGATSSTYTPPNAAMDSSGRAYTCAVIIDGVLSDESTTGVTIKGKSVHNFSDLLEKQKPS